MTAPTATENAPLAHIRNILAECAAFQTLVGAANPAEALNSIKFLEYAIERADRPMAVVGHPEQTPAHTPLTPRMTVVEDSGLLLIEENADVNDDMTERLIVFENTIGAIIAEFRAEAYDYGFRMLSAPVVHDRAFVGYDQREEGDEPYCGVAYRIEWGDMLT